MTAGYTFDQGETIETARLRRIVELADTIDRNVAATPGLAASQVGFAAGLIVNAIRGNPAEALDQLTRIGALLGKALAFVDRGEPVTDSDLLAGLGALED